MSRSLPRRASARTISEMSSVDAKMAADEIISLLGLEPHPEGGYFVETFRDAAGSGRARSTAIYYLLKAGERSHWHRVDAAEIWHWHAGGPLSLSISADGKLHETDTRPRSRERTATSTGGSERSLAGGRTARRFHPVAAPSRPASSSRALKWRRRAGARAVNADRFCPACVPFALAAARLCARICRGLRRQGHRRGTLSTLAGIVVVALFATTATYADENSCLAIRLRRGDPRRNGADDRRPAYGNMQYPQTVPLGLEGSGPDLRRWSGPRKHRRILDTLDRHCVKATFFMVGYYAARHPEIVREVAARPRHRHAYLAPPEQLAPLLTRSGAARNPPRLRGRRSSTRDAPAEDRRRLALLPLSGPQ